jgi:hypothetical protein
VSSQKLQLAADALLKRETKLPATIYWRRICEEDDEKVEFANDLEVRTVVTIQNLTGQNPTKWDKTGIAHENNPHNKVDETPAEERLFEDVTEIREHDDGSSSPRPELAGKNLPSRPPVRGDQVDEAPAVVGGGVPDVGVDEIQDNQKVHHQVDAWQENHADAIHDDVPLVQEDNFDEKVMNVTPMRSTTMLM